MSSPENSASSGPATSDEAPVLDGTDITADPGDLDTSDRPATSDPEQLTDEGQLGGAGGQGGAG